MSNVIPLPRAIPFERSETVRRASAIKSLRAMPFDKRARILLDKAHGQVVEHVMNTRQMPSRAEYLNIVASSQRITSLLDEANADPSSIVAVAAAAIIEKRAVVAAQLFDPDELARIERMGLGDDASTIHRHSEPAPWRDLGPTHEAFEP